MRAMIRFAFPLCLLAGAAGAQCPDPPLSADTFAVAGPELITPRTWPVEAIGRHSAPCAEWETETGIVYGDLEGYLPEVPTAVFELDNMGPHILMVMAETACDPVLAVRSADGLWYFGERRNDRQEVTIWGAPNEGALQVWVGAGAETQCDGTVILETFDR